MVRAWLLYAVATWPLWCGFVECQQRLISLDGAWSPWSTVTTNCIKFNGDGSISTVTCGGGTQQQYRSCTNPKPQVRILIFADLLMSSCCAMEARI
jgi:hypothetical protein